jgi:DNA helicase IV
MLARRCPSGSMTVVGDFGQASRPGAARSWDEVLEHLPRHDEPRRVTLTVNYRTPAEIMDLANRLLAVAATGVEPTSAVRRTGEPPRFTRVTDLVAGAADAAREALAAGGTVAVIAPLDLHPAVTAALADAGAVSDSPEALDAPVGVLVPTDAKGLEFDHVIVVEPARLVQPDSAGLRLLYVTLTRATRTLTVVHADGLPEALAP